MNARRLGLAAVAVASVAAVGWMLFGRGRSEAAPEGQPAEEASAVPVSIATVATAATPQWYESVGATRPQFEVVLATKVMGRVTRVAARVGDRVRRGQPLVTLDSRDLDAAVAQASAGRRSAGVSYDSARVAADMERRMSEARISEGRAAVAQAEAGLKAARARLDLVRSGPRRQEKAQAGLAVVQAKAGLDLAEATYRRMQGLAAEGAISQLQHDQARMQLDVARAQLDTARQGQSISDEGSRSEDVRGAEEAVRLAEAAVDQAQSGLRQAQAAAAQIEMRKSDIRAASAGIGLADAALRAAHVVRGYTVVVAPLDGVVSERMVDEGAMAAPGSPLLKVQGGAMRLEAVVPEGLIPRLRPGTAVPISLDAIAGRTMNARVAEIAPQGDPASHTFIARLELPAGSAAKAGMFGRARIATGRIEALSVPTTALIDREGLAYVYVVGPNDRAALRLVTVGARDQRNATVLSGLTAGERVVSTIPRGLHDGAKVTAGR